MTNKLTFFVLSSLFLSIISCMLSCNALLRRLVTRVFCRDLLQAVPVVSVEVTLYVYVPTNISPAARSQFERAQTSSIYTGFPVHHRTVSNAFYAVIK